MGIAGWIHVGNIRIWRQMKGRRFDGALLLDLRLEHARSYETKAKREDVFLSSDESRGSISVGVV